MQFCFKRDTMCVTTGHKKLITYYGKSDRFVPLAFKIVITVQSAAQSLPTLH
jgi:hypothetical protein